MGNLNTQNGSEDGVQSGVMAWVAGQNELGEKCREVLKSDVDSLSEYVRWMEDSVGELSRSDRLPNPVLLFRGHSKDSYELIPSIARGGTPEGYDSLLSYEADLIYASRRSLPNLFKSTLGPIDLLALLQHFGVPTRLLDVTENPLAALFFACKDNQDADGEVIVFKTNDIDEQNYPVCEAIADSYNLLDCQQTTLSTFYDRMIGLDYFRYQRPRLEEDYIDDAGKESWIHECCEKLIHVRGAVESQRQSAQSGRYILFPNAIGDSWWDEGELPVFENRIKPICKDDGKLVFARLRVPAESKKNLLCSLKIMGITEATLFPDSLDKVCGGIVDRVVGESNAVRRMRGWKYH